MSVTLPAPVWRRFAASIYDGLLLLGLWMVVLLIDLLVRDTLGLPRSYSSLQALEFIVGLGFFGRSWTRGGQSLGMRSWKLRVRRLDGAALRWPVAAVRYAVMLLTWFAALLPTMALLVPALRQHVHAATLFVAAAIYSIVALLAMLLDGRRRALCDFAAQTEVVVEPPTAAA